MKPKEGEGINDFAIRAGYSGSQELMSKHPDLIFRDAETGYPFVDFMTDYPVANPSTGGGDIDQYIKMVDQDYEANGNIFTFGARDLAKRESTDASRENKEIKGLFGTVMNPNQQTTVPKLMEDQAIIEEEPAIDSEPELVDISDDSGDDSKKIWKQGMTSEQFNALFNNSVDRNVLNPAAKKALQDAIKIAEGEYKFWTEEHNAEIDLDKLTEAVDKKINAYTEKLDLIANEEAPPPFEGSTTRQVLAVVGAALGAAAASFSGSPNWALQILDKALDREQAQFIKKQEFKMLSAREQRMILVEQRGEMIQYALSKTKQAIAARQGATQSLGALKSIEAQMIQGAQQNLDVLAVNEVKNFYAFVAQMQATHGKRHGKYYGRIGTIIGTKSKEQLNLLNKELSELARGVISIEELSARAPGNIFAEWNAKSRDRGKIIQTGECISNHNFSRL